MKRKVHIIYILLAGLLAFSACTKTSQTNVNTTIKHNYGSYTFINPSNTPINVAVYRTKHEYAKDSNALIKFKLIPYGRRVVNNTIDIGNKIYYDCYSDDFMYHNWTNVLFDLAYTYSATNSKGDVTPTIVNNNYRLMFLKGNDSTHWEAVDAYNVGLTASVWDSLPAYQHYFQFNVKRDFDFAYSLKDQTNYTHYPNPDSNTLKLNGSAVSVVSGFQSNPYINLSFTTALPGRSQAAIDTLICSSMLGGSNFNVAYRYVLVRK